jgi:hypothetical protein
MANVLSTDKKIAVIGALAEGSSIRRGQLRSDVSPSYISRLPYPLTAIQAAIMQEYRNVTPY